MKQLRKKYAINSTVETKSVDIPKAAENTNCEDDRPQLVDSDNPFEKTQLATVEEAKLWQQMLPAKIWLQNVKEKDSDGFDKGFKGQVEPVKSEESPDRQELGANGSNPKLAFNRSILKRKAIIRKTQERFDRLC